MRPSQLSLAVLLLGASLLAGCATPLYVKADYLKSQLQLGADVDRLSVRLSNDDLSWQLWQSDLALEHNQYYCSLDDECSPSCYDAYFQNLPGTHRYLNVAWEAPSGKSSHLMGPHAWICYDVQSRKILGWRYWETDLEGVRAKQAEDIEY